MFFDGDIIEIEDYKRKWIALFVTKWDIEFGRIDAKRPGLHAFGGMWHGDNPLSIHSFGKILPLDGTEKVISKVTDHSVTTIRKMVD